MTTEFQIPDMGTFVFPDDMPVEEAEGLMREQFPALFEPVPLRDDNDLEGVIPDTPVNSPVIPRPQQQEPEEGEEFGPQEFVGPRRPIDELVYEGLEESEGASGTNVAGDVATGLRGLTTATYDAVRQRAGDPNMSEEDAAKFYIREMDDGFTDRLPGYKQLPRDVKVAFLDNTYNLNWERVSQWRGLSSDLADYQRGDATAAEVMENLLDTANAQGRSMRGLAIRRAKAYNVASPDDPITDVEQTETGIKYYKGDNVFYSYLKKRKSDSKVGKVAVD